MNPNPDQEVPDPELPEGTQAEEENPDDDDVVQSWERSCLLGERCPICGRDLRKHKDCGHLVGTMDDCHGDWWASGPIASAVDRLHRRIAREFLPDKVPRGGMEDALGEAMQEPECLRQLAELCERCASCSLSDTSDTDNFACGDSNSIHLWAKSRREFVARLNNIA